MRFNHTATSYHFFDSKTQSPLLANDKKKDGAKDDPKKKKDDDDFIDHDDDDLKNIDQSRGGYGHGTGFDKKE